MHSGARVAGTAVALMRARFSAFTLGNPDYLLATWHTDTRPAQLDLDGTVIWRRLQIVDTDAGGAPDSTGVVEFRAQYEHHGKRHIMHERSRFARTENGSWCYLDGDVRD